MINTTVIAVQKETPDTVTLRIAAPMEFIPGQFAMVSLNVREKPVRRSYSIACAPNSEYVELTVKEQERGTFSKYAQTMRPGHEITLHGPFGHHFLFDPATHDPKTDVVFIAGGSGISPFRSMLQTAAREGYKGKISLIYSVRTSQDIIYHEELARLAGKLNLDLTITLTRPSEDDVSHWKGFVGRVTPAFLAKELGEDLQEKQYYICGPTPMVQHVQAVLSEAGVQKDHVKTEKFGQIES